MLVERRLEKMSRIAETFAALRMEVADNMYQPPIESKNEGWIDSTMEVAREFGLTVHDEMCMECHNADMRVRCPLRKRVEEALP